MDTNVITNTNENIEIPVPVKKLFRASVRRRCLAYLTDYFIMYVCLIAVTLLCFYAVTVTESFIPALLMLPAILLFVASFVLRDVIFGRASIGKRILHIKVVDSVTGEDASAKARAIRGFASFITFFDFIFLVGTKKSLGDRLGNTTVVYTETHEEIVDGEVVQTAPKKRGGALAICTVILSFVLLVVIMVCGVFFTMDKAKDTESYAVAEEFILESTYFESLGVSEDELVFTGYTSKIENGTAFRYYTFTISTDEFAHSIQICLYKTDSGWQIDESRTGVQKVR